MTLPRPDFLFPEELAQIGVDVAGLVADPQVRVLVTYRDFASRTFVPSTGTTTNVYSDYASVGAVRNAVPTGEVAAADGLYKSGDIRYTFSRADVPVEPDVEDRIVDGAATYGVVAWDTDPIQQLWRVVARLIA